MNDGDDKKYGLKKTFEDVGGTIRTDASEQPPSGDTTVYANPTRLTLKTYPATITITSSGTLRAATASAQRMLDIVDPKRGDMTDHFNPFIKQIKKKDEVTVKTVRASKTRTFADIGVDIGALSEEDAELAVDAYYETRAQRRGFLWGVVTTALVGIAGVVLTAIGLYLMSRQ